MNALQTPMPRIPVDPPRGFEKIRPFLDKIEAEMRRLENAPLSPKLQENYWPIFQLHHQRSRHIYNLRKKGEVDEDLYRYLRENRFADHELMCCWDRMGYEHLCCLRCIQPIDSKHGNVCICRVPHRSSTDQLLECDNCGCRGCSGY